MHPHKMMYSFANKRFMFVNNCFRSDMCVVCIEQAYPSTDDTEKDKNRRKKTHKKMILREIYVNNLDLVLFVDQATFSKFNCLKLFAD